MSGVTAMQKISKLPIATDGENDMKRDMPPVHPGEILFEDFLKPLGITQYRLAKSIGVPQRRIGEIVAGKRALTADTALRLARSLGPTRRAGSIFKRIMIWKLPKRGWREG